MSVNALFLSNGTCFFGPGQVADPNFIPCGNAELSGPQACCYVGDHCLSSTACWDNETVVTYVAGCTDSTFSSSQCTNKFDYPDQQYVAMARCEGDDLDIWSGCYHHPDWIEIQKEPDCHCNASRPLIRNPNGKSTLDDVGLLPTTPGGTISFQPTAIPTLENGAPNSSSVSFTSPAATSSSIPSAASSQGLSTGAKVGIGVGVGVGVPVLAGLAVFAFILWRRKSAASVAPTPAPAANSETQNEAPHEGEQVAVAQEKPSSPEKELTTTPEPPSPSQAWYGFKPELAANSAQKSELSGDEPRSLGTSSWNSGTLQMSELSSHDAVTSAVERNSWE
ncbi:hypothetical protein GGR54DRAFT_641547 [Hypoxylon sp. NC1633]|nr:hypothetical protein GGR54DRAFT_641547 [Hypoxylon sp. NC1633]